MLVAVIAILMLLPGDSLGGTHWRQRLKIGSLMGLASVLAIFLPLLFQVGNGPDFRPTYVAVAIFLFGRRAGLTAWAWIIAATVLLRPAGWAGQCALLTGTLLCGDLCRRWYRHGGSYPRLRFWSGLVLLAVAMQALGVLGEHLDWLPRSVTLRHWRFITSTFLLACCAELLLMRHRAQAQLASRETELLLVLESSGSGRWEWDVPGHRTQFKGSFYDQFDIHVDARGDALAGWMALWHPDDLERVGAMRPALERRPAGEDVFETEFRVRDRQGHWCWILSRGRIVERAADGRALRMLGMHHDVSRRRQVDEALRISQAKFQTIYEALPDAAGITHLSDGRYKEINPAFTALTGYSREQAIGHTSIELHVWAHESEREALLRELRDKGRVDNLPLRARSIDGRVIPGLMSARHIDMDGESCLLFLFHDTSQQQEMESQLLRVNALLQQAGRLARLGVWEDSPDPAERYWSDVCYELHGLDPGGAVPEHFAERFVTEPFRQAFVQGLRSCIEERRGFELEMQIRRADDARLVWVHAMAEPVVRDGKVVRIRGVLRDIDETHQSQERLRQSEERFARIFKAIPDPMGICRKSDGHYLEVNPAWEASSGFSRDEALAGVSALELGLYRETLRQSIATAARQAGTLNGYEVEFTPRHGGVRTALQSMQTIDFDGEACWLFGIKDITERKQAERQLQEREALLSLTIEAASLALWDMDLLTGLVTGDHHWREIRGLDPAQADPPTPERWLDILFPEDRLEARNALNRHLQVPGQPFDVTLRVRHADGELRWVRNLGRVIEQDPAGQARRMVGVALDVTRQRLQEEQLQRLAHYDALTSLPNRVRLADTLDMAMQLARRQKTLLGVAYLDLDGFKPVNDRLGHSVGDKLLVEVARRLQAAVRSQDMVARLGGDEFVILLTNPGQWQDCETMLRRLMQQLAEPVWLEGESMVVTASIGLTLFPQDDSDADTLLRHADQAMYQAKQAGRNRIHLFDAERERASREHNSRLDRLGEALEREEFRLFVQPKVDMRSGAVTGVEALARWQHPERGLLAPGEFLPQIEGSSLEQAFGEWVIRASLELTEGWLAQGLSMPLSLNISARHLQTRDFPERMRQLLVRHPQVPARLLEIEITESAALTDIRAVTHTLTQLRTMGLSIAIDDFGTGYSSLTYLRLLPADALKIDRSFVHGMMLDPGDMAIVNGVIGLSRSFGLSLIAEGVETEQQGLRLLELGCHLAQGYGIARPMPASELPAWIQQWQAPQAWLRLAAPTA